MPRAASVSVERTAARSAARPKAAAAPTAAAGRGSGRATGAAAASVGRPGPTDDQLLRDSLGLQSERTAQSQAVAYGVSPGDAAGVWDGVAPQVLEPPTPMDPSDHPPADVDANVLTPVSQAPS